MQGRTGELIDLDYVLRVDVGKVQNPWYEDVDLEPLEAGFVAICAPVQDPPPICGVLRPDGVESVVFLAKLSLDGLCTARERGEAKDVKVLIQTVSEHADVCAFLHSSTPLVGDPRRVCRVCTPSLQ